MQGSKKIHASCQKVRLQKICTFQGNMIGSKTYAKLLKICKSPENMKGSRKACKAPENIKDSRKVCKDLKRHAGKRSLVSSANLAHPISIAEGGRMNMLETRLSAYLFQNHKLHNWLHLCCQSHHSH